LPAPAHPMPSTPPPPGLKARETTWGTIADLAAALAIGLALVVVVLTYRDYGITWDETWHLVYGDHVLAWYETLGADRSSLCYRVDFMYGGGFDLLGAIVRRFSPLGPYETIHLFGALLGVVGIVGTWRLARSLAGPVAGLVAVLLLCTTPVWWGHQFNNPKDLPFAVGYVWALHALVQVVRALPRPSTGAWVRLAILVGLAMSVRIAGLLLLCYLVGAVGVFAILRGRAGRSVDLGVRTFGRLVRPVLGTILGAWVVMLAFWPWAQLDPIRRPFLALGRMSRFTIHERTMPFAGEEMLTTEPRPDYLLHYFGLKLPAVVLVLFLAGVVLAALALRRPARPRLRLSDIAVWGTISVAIAFPPVYAIVARSVLYDGLRHFLFLVPIMVAVGAVAIVVLVRRYYRSSRVTVVAFCVGMAGLQARVVPEMIELHPNQYVYFNQFIGGLPGAFLRYDTDYYGNSYKEAFAALADHLWDEDPERYLRSTWVVTGCIPDFVAWQYLPGGFRFKDKHDKDRNPQFYLGYTRGNCHNGRYKNSPVLLEVKRQDTLLTVVRDLRRGDEDPDAEADRRRKERRRKAQKKKQKQKGKAGARPAEDEDEGDDVQDEPPQDEPPQDDPGPDDDGFGDPSF
jgi:hypothetical protein